MPTDKPEIKPSLTAEERRRRLTFAYQRQELADIRRKLGPYTAIQGDEPWRGCDAEIARCLVRVVAVMDAMLEEPK